MSPQFQKAKLVLYKLSREKHLYNHLKLIRWFFRSLWQIVNVFSIIPWWRLCWARVSVLHKIQESIHSEQYHRKNTKGLGKENHYSLLTIEVSRVTNIKFLLTISAYNQVERLWELLKSSLKGKCFDLLTNSLKKFRRNVCRAVWRICMLILGLKGSRN